MTCSFKPLFFAHSYSNLFQHSKLWVVNARNPSSSSSWRKKGSKERRKDGFRVAFLRETEEVLGRKKSADQGWKAKKDRKWVEGLLSLSGETRGAVWQEPGQGSYCHWAISTHYPPVSLPPLPALFIHFYFLLSHHVLCITFSCTWFLPPSHVKQVENM